METNNLHLKKFDLEAEENDYMDVDKYFNKNWDKIDEGYQKHEKKLSGIQEGANNYKHPATHSASIIREDSSHRFVTDQEKEKWNDKASLKELNEHIRDYEEFKDQAEQPDYATVGPTIHPIISLPSSSVKGQVSAKIGGRTQTNYAPSFDEFNNSVYIEKISTRKIKFTSQGRFTEITADISYLEPSTEYSLIGVILGGRDITVDVYKSGVIDIDGVYFGKSIDVFTTPEDTQDLKLRVVCYGERMTIAEYRIIEDLMILKGNHKNGGINYTSKGTKSTVPNIRVRAMNQNLWDGTYDVGYFDPQSSIEKLISGSSLSKTTKWIRVRPNTTIRIVNGNRCRWQYKDISGNVHWLQENSKANIPQSAEYVRVYYYNGENPQNIMIVYDDITSPDYIPHEHTDCYISVSHQLDSLSDDDKDEIYEENGKLWLKKRTGKIILDGSRNWRPATEQGGWYVGETHAFYLESYEFELPDEDMNVSCGQFYTISNTSIVSTDTEGVGNARWKKEGHLTFRILSSKLETLDVSGLKKWLSEKPLLVTYQLAEPKVYENGENGFSVTGSLESFGEGTTIQIDPYLKKSYTIENTAITLDYPISSIDSFQKFVNGTWIDATGTLSEDGKTITVSSEGTYKVEGVIRSEEHAGQEITLNIPVNQASRIESIEDLAIRNADLILDLWGTTLALADEQLKSEVDTKVELETAKSKADNAYDLAYTKLDKLDFTGSEILNRLKTVDRLNANMLQGLQAIDFANAHTRISGITDINDYFIDKKSGIYSGGTDLVNNYKDSAGMYLWQKYRNNWGFLTFFEYEGNGRIAYKFLSNGQWSEWIDIGTENNTLFMANKKYGGHKELPYNLNWNNLLNNGIYSVAQEDQINESLKLSRNQPEGAYGYGTLMVVKGEAGAIYQTYVTHHSSGEEKVIYFRSGYAGSFRPWAKIPVYALDKDAITVETGSNSNGSYIKYSNGMLHMWNDEIFFSGEKFKTITTPVTIRGDKPYSLSYSTSGSFVEMHFNSIANESVSTITIHSDSGVISKWVTVNFMGYWK